MKKNFCLCLILVLAMFLTSCSQAIVHREINTDPTYVFETDAWSGYSVRELHIMTESEDSYYYVSLDCYVHVIDKKTMNDTILCNKPNCLHDKRMIATNDQAAECNAYVEGPGIRQSIFYYEGALYTLGNQRKVANSTGEVIPTLMKLSLDGSSRKNIWEMKFETENKVTVPNQYLLHRGIFYFIAPTETNDGHNYIFGYDIHTKKLKEIYKDTRYLGELKVIGNSLYIRRSSIDNVEAESYLKYDLATGETIIFENGAGAVRDQNGAIVYCYQRIGDELTHKFETVQHDGTNRQPLDITLEVHNGFKYLQSNGKYLFITEVMGLGKYTVEVYDIATRQKVAGLLVPEEMRNTRSRYWLMCTTDGKLILYDDTQRFGYLFYYGNIDAIAEDDFRWIRINRLN